MSQFLHSAKTVKKDKQDYYFVKNGFNQESDHFATWKIRSFTASKLKRVKPVYTVSLKLDALRKCNDQI